MAKTVISEVRTKRGCRP